MAFQRNHAHEKLIHLDIQEHVSEDGKAVRGMPDPWDDEDTCWCGEPLIGSQLSEED